MMSCAAQILHINLFFLLIINIYLSRDDGVNITSDDVIFHFWPGFFTRWQLEN